MIVYDSKSQYFIPLSVSYCQAVQK